MTDQLELSVIVPFYNEEDNIRLMHTAIVRAIEPLGLDFEMIFIDDGSSDSTLDRAVAVARQDERLKVVKFRRNYGQTAAMAAGIDIASGRVLVTMDGDLQNDPADIVHLLARIDEGYDLVVGWRFNRQDRLLSRTIPSRAANWLIGKVTGISISDSGCSLKAYRSSLIKHIPLYSDMHRLIPALTSIAGSRVTEVKVRHHPRQFGRSKYGLSRIYKVLLDLVMITTVVSFAARPLVLFSVLAAPPFLLGCAALGLSMWSWVITTCGLPLPLAGTGILLLMCALMLVGSGLVAELTYRLGDTRESDFSRLTSKAWADSAVPPGAEILTHE